MIQDFADWLVYGIFGLDAGTSLGVAVNFFFYDTIKILILLFFISVLMGIINAYFPIERLRNYLVTHKMYGLQYLLASVFGAITPFCSCSSIPLFIGFVKGGIPLGVTFAFLITSPLVNEVAVAMFLGTFGLKVTMIYVISGILLGVIGGFVLGKMNLSPYLSDWVRQIQANSSAQAEEWEKDHTTFLKRLPSIVRDAWKIVSGVLIYIIIGIGIGAFMHGFVPEGFFEQYMSKENWYAVPVSVILAVPMTRLATFSPFSFFVILIFSSKPYCPRWASSVMTTIFFRKERGSSDSSNFCMVVKIMPFASRPDSRDFKSSRLFACMGTWRKKSWHLEN